MPDTVHINAVGRAHLDSLVEAGKVDAGEWNAPNKGAPNQFLAVDTSAPANTEAHYKYPFSATGDTVNKKALAAIESYATQNNEPEIAAAAHAALAKINSRSKNMSAIEMQEPLRDREIFAAGVWNASTGEVKVDGPMLDRMVENYAALNSKVPGFAIPIKLGHNKRVGEPAYGYAENIRRKGDTLIADFNDVPPEIVDAIGKRSYNSVSVEIWPSVKYAGKVFKDVLSGVALLGAEWPAVKGLQPLYASAFADNGDGPMLLSQEETDDMPNFTQEQHDALVEAAVAKAKTEATDAAAAQIAELTTKVTTESQRADTAETALRAFTDEKEKSDLAAIIEAAEKDGKIVPANKVKVTAFAEAVRTAVSGDQKKVLMSSFKDFIEGLPKKVDYSENGQSRQRQAGQGSVQDEINEKVAQLRKADVKLSYKDALEQVFSADPDLKTRYAEENR